ncbi:hypothetical protein ACMGD3_18135 [Lysinibacillus sphaericus]|uniref:hypothetical protein n=1 Tax=Lysinibacillus sphaericus TaxID=1421 RepID=UPI003F7AB240
MNRKPRKEIHNGLTYNFFELHNDKICFMFSGTDYTYEKPLLYYSTALMLELGYDVVQICYSFEQQQLEQEPKAISEMVYSATNPIVTFVLNNKPYQEAVYIGKSLGTLPIVDFYMQQDTSSTSRYVLFTPLLALNHIVQNLQDKHAFLAIGTADPHFSKEKLDQLNSHHLAIVENANHSLELVNNTLTSMTLCQTLLKELQLFMQK